MIGISVGLRLGVPRRPTRHQHDWERISTTMVGWVLWRCRTCGRQRLRWES